MTRAEGRGRGGLGLLRNGDESNMHKVSEDTPCRLLPAKPCQEKARGQAQKQEWTPWTVACSSTPRRVQPCHSFHVQLQLPGIRNSNTLGKTPLKPNFHFLLTSFLWCQSRVTSLAFAVCSNTLCGKSVCTVIPNYYFKELDVPS